MKGLRNTNVFRKGIVSRMRVLLHLLLLIFYEIIFIMMIPLDQLLWVKNQGIKNPVMNQVAIYIST